MSTTVSADGKTVVFDLVGRLYAVPVMGGVAIPLTDPGEAWDFCPRFSPDGERLAFLSDRAGPADVWVMDWNTREVRQVSRAGQLQSHDGDLSSYNFSCAPAWTLDSEAIVGRDNVVSRPTAYMSYLPVNGIGSPRVITVEKIPEAALSLPASVIPLADGRRAIADVVSTFPQASSGKGRRRDLYWLDLASGDLSPLRDAGTGGSAYGPQLSPSGRLLAYLLRRSRDEIELRLRNLETGADRRLSALIGAADFAQRGDREVPGYAFTPDERYVVIAYGGSIHRVATGTGADIVIPFEAVISRKVAGRLKAHHRLEDGPVAVRAQRWPMVSAERDLLIFSAAGSVWARMLPGGVPRRVGSGETLDSMAALSPDGTRVAYVAYESEPNAIPGPGRLMMQTIGETRAVPAMDDNASYYWPTWSPDQSKIAVVRRAGDDRRDGQGGDAQDATAELGWIDLADRTFHPVARVDHYLAEDFRGGEPRWISWSGDGERLFFQGFKGWGAASRAYREPVTVEEVRVDGSGRRVITQGGLDIHAIVPSPDLAHVAFIGWDQNAYLVALDELRDTPLQISLGMPGARRISTAGALYPRWAGKRRLVYGWMNRVFEYRIGQRAAQAEEIARTTLSLDRRHGRGILAFRDARLITMAGEEGAGPVIERGTVVVRNRRIVAIGAVDAIAIPEGARQIDATGLTIMPGLVDTHYHGVQPDTLSFYTPGAIDGGDRALAYGITTAFEPGGGSIDDSAEDWRILLETGRMRGPRWFFDSIKDRYLRPDDAAESLADLRARLERKRDLGNGPCIKELANHDGAHARLVARAAREAGVCVVAHVEHHPIHSISRVANGAALHHNSLLPPLYDDIVHFLAQAGMSWTPHIALEWNMDMPRETQPRDSLPVLLKRLDVIMDVSDRARFARYFETHERYGPMLDRYRGAPLDLFEHSGRPGLLAAADKLLDAGVHISLSGHDRLGPLRGEMLDWQEGGLSPGRILRAATLGGAEQLGLGRDLGSLEPGKIADFLVLKANPLEDVLNTIRLKWIVIDGVVYESEVSGMPIPARAGPVR